jgi:hypothetical protein
MRIFELDFRKWLKQSIVERTFLFLNPMFENKYKFSFIVKALHYFGGSMYLFFNTKPFIYFKIFILLGILLMFIYFNGCIWSTLEKRIEGDNYFDITEPILDVLGYESVWYNKKFIFSIYWTIMIFFNLWILMF